MFKNLRIGVKLTLLTVLGVVGLALFAGYGFTVLERVRVNGPLYQQLKQNQELVADILPPPSYIIESYLTASQMLIAAEKQDTTSINAYAEKMQKLKTDFETRHTYWVNASKTHTTQSQALQLLINDAYTPAQEFYNIYEKQFLPAIQAGKVSQASNIYNTQLTTAYTAHRSIIDNVVTLQEAESSASETQTNQTLARDRSVLFVVGLATALFMLFLGIIVARSISVPVTQLTENANKIAKGDLKTRAVVTSTDEVGSLAQAFNGMADQLSQTLSGLEQRVADRTKAIATSSEVSRRLSAIRNRGRLVNEVVTQVQDAFGYYHAHIYLTEGDDLVMAGGTGDVGAALLASGHIVQMGRGLVGRAAEKNEPVLVTDTSQDPGWLPNPLLPDTKSEVAIPISVGNQVLGVLDVQHDAVYGLGQEDVDLLISIANQVAIAMQNITSAEIVTKRAKELQTVAAISTTAATIPDTFEMLSTVVHLTQRGFGLYHAHVFTFHEEDNDLQIVACGYKEGDEHEGTHGTTVIPMEQEQSLVARAARTRQPVIVNDVRSDPGWLPNPLLPETRAEMAVPMIVGNTLMGVLDVQSEHTDFFTEEDANIQMTLASQVATALQNARSFVAAQKRAEDETKLNLISQRIQSTTSVEAALQVAARELGRALGYKPTAVALDATTPLGSAKTSAGE